MLFIRVWFCCDALDETTVKLIHLFSQEKMGLFYLDILVIRKVFAVFPLIKIQAEMN